MTKQFKKKIHYTLLLLMVSIICTSIGLVSYNSNSTAAYAANYVYRNVGNAGGDATGWWKNPSYAHELTSVGQYGAANISPRYTGEAGWIGSGVSNNLTNSSATEVAFDGSGMWAVIYFNFYLNLGPEYDSLFSKGEVVVDLSFTYRNANGNADTSHLRTVVTESDDVVQRGQDNNTFIHAKGNDLGNLETGLTRLATGDDKLNGSNGKATKLYRVNGLTVDGNAHSNAGYINYGTMPINGAEKTSTISFKPTKKWFTVFLGTAWSSKQTFRYKNFTVNVKEKGAPTVTNTEPTSGWAVEKSSKVTVSDPSGIRSVTVDGATQSLNSNGQFDIIAKNNKTVNVVATDNQGNITTKTIIFNDIYSNEVAIKRQVLGSTTGIGGTPSSDKVKYTHGETIQLTSTYFDGFYFAGWYLNDILLSDITSYNQLVDKDLYPHGTKLEFVAKYQAINDRSVNQVIYNGTKHDFSDITLDGGRKYTITDLNGNILPLSVTDANVYNYLVKIYTSNNVQIGASRSQILTINKASVMLYRDSSITKTYDTLAIGALAYRFTLNGNPGVLDSNNMGTLFDNDQLQSLTWNVTDHTEAGNYAINVDLTNKATNNYEITWDTVNGADGRPNSVIGQNYIINKAKIWMYRDSVLTKVYDGDTIPKLTYHFQLEGAVSTDTLFGEDTMPSQNWNIDGAKDCTYNGQVYLGHVIQGNLIAPTNNYQIDWWTTDNAADGKSHNPFGQYFVITRASQEISFSETQTTYKTGRPMWAKAGTTADSSMSTPVVYNTNDPAVIYIDDNNLPYIIRSTYQKTGVSLTASIALSNNYEAATKTVEIDIDRAVYLANEVAIQTDLKGTYDSTKKLSDFTLNSYFTWVSDTICPTVRKNDEGYNALYNVDPTNYYDYSCYIKITLNPATHGIVVDQYKDLVGSLNIKHTSINTSLPLLTVSKSGFDVEFSTQSGSARYTVTDSIITFNSIGTTTIKAYVSDKEGNYIPYEDYFTITVRGNQDIKFTETEYIKFDSTRGIYIIDNIVTYGDSALSVQALALGTRLATISLIDAKDKNGTNVLQSNIALYDNFQLFIKGAGSIKLKASLAGSQDYLATEEIIEITIAPRILNVSFEENLIIDYGKFNPNNTGLVLNYSNFATGDNIGNIRLKAPTIVNNDDLSQFSNIGEYSFSIANGDATNYTLELLEMSKITVVPVEVTINHQLFITTYNGINQGIEKSYTNAIGVDGGSRPTGAISYKYLIDGEIKNEAPINSGDYEIILVYDVGVDDNYKMTTRQEQLGLKISKASIVVTIADLHLIYGTFNNANVNDYFTLVYEGFVNNETESTANGFKVPSIQNLNGLTQFSDVTSGGYTFSINGGFADNYELEITDTGIIYIDKASVTVTISDASVKYGEYLAGQNHTTFGTVYSGFLNNQSVALGSVGGFVAPSIVASDEEINRYSKVGTYNFELKGGSSTNYTFIITDTAVLTIAPTAILVKGASLAYNGGAIQFSPNNIQGIANGSGLSGSYTIYYSSDNINFSTEPRTNAGSYYIKISYVEGLEDNYATGDYFDTLVINRIAITDAVIDNIVNNNVSYKYNNQTGYAANYNGMIHQPVGRIFGLEEQSIGNLNSPQGTFSFIYSTNGSNYVDQAPKNSGEYYIKVRYISATVDNYTNNNSLVIGGRIVINKINIAEITLPEISKNYTGKGITAAVPFASGIAQGTIPQGTYIRQYAKHGTDNWSANLPIDAGEYDVKVRFVSNANDNYLDSSEDKLFSKALIIKKIYAKMSVTSKIYNYGDVAVASVTPLDINNAAMTDGVMTYTYIINNVESMDIPTHSGKYAVKAVFTPSENSNYLVTSNRYNNAVIILNITPTITLHQQKIGYNGSEINAEIIMALAKLDEKNGKANGSLVIEYKLHGVDTWSRISPKEAGIYDIRVKYVENYLSDNYSSSLNWVELSEALDISRIEAIIVIAEGQSKIYDGKAIDASTIQYDIMVNDQILANLIFGNYITGNLSVTSDANCGVKNVEIGSLSAGNNYSFKLQHIGYYEILQKEITLTLSLTNNIYDGLDKEVAVDISEIIIGDDIGLQLAYTGERKAYTVEGFSVEVSLSNANYDLVSNTQETFFIQKAKMTNNSYQSKTVVYNGKNQTFLLDSIEEGADVEYLEVTEFINAGEYNLKAIVTKPNYIDEELTAKVTIKKATPNIVVYPVGKKLYYGDAIPSITCNIAEGIISIDAGQELVGGTNGYKYTFIPSDLDNYNIVKGIVTLTVEKYEPIIIVNGNIRNYQNQEFIIETILSGLDQAAFEPEISFISSNGAKFKEVPTAVGEYIMIIRYNGDENYNAVEYRTTYTVIAAPNYTPIFVVVGVLVLLFVASGIMFAIRRKKNNNNY